MDKYNISSPLPSDTHNIVACFRQVYGDSYANEDFYDEQKLASLMVNSRMSSVGAVCEDGKILAHMAMKVHPGASSVELGKTVVDPSMRGEGLACNVSP